MILSPKWICHSKDNRKTQLVPVFRRYFAVRAGLKKATLYISAHGLYEAEINSRPVTANRFTPGFTSYYYRAQSQKYDVTDLVHKGKNLWQTTVGDGWWRWNNNFSGTLALWGRLELDYGNRTESVLTDNSFEVGIGPIQKTDLQIGETYDARIEPGKWQPAVLCTEHTEGLIIPTEGVPVSGWCIWPMPLRLKPGI